MSVIENYFLPHVCDQDSKLQDNPNARSLLIGYFTAWCSLLYESVNSHILSQEMWHAVQLSSLCAVPCQFKIASQTACINPFCSTQMPSICRIYPGLSFTVTLVLLRQQTTFFLISTGIRFFTKFSSATTAKWTIQPFPSLHHTLLEKRKLNERAGHWFFAVIHSEPVLQLCLLYISAGYFKTYAYGESNLLAGYFPQNLQHHAENGP